ncbi:glyoxylate/hydroxypyruvate reductase A-like [Anneissia japonica]|uniref:glyoxylate/hydroxypyruvate reductase A-like n=1 Tax=Anneissia japonica TaxID=1529436 RepID=UPI001425668B|nr:glyoxylate/hydroxypyruvate reductase A-like [Anneissia japonica]XP_033102276.1 glyoxylate/hydroxypyruvate reductase A-like [Anneissia japonica]
MAAKKKLPLVVIFCEFPEVYDHIRKLDATIPLQLIEVTNMQAPEISETALRQLKEADILITDPILLLQFYKQLTAHTKWVQSTYAGQDHFFKHLDYSKPLPEFSLCKFGHILGVHLAEYVIGRLIAHERKFYDRYEAQQVKEWRQECPYRLLSDLTIGILGVGDIGSQIANYCKFLGMKVWGMVRRDLPIDKRSSYVDQYCLTSDLPVLLSNCDVVCNVLPSTPQTIGILSGEVLAGAKEKKPIFINVGRGDVIDEESIIKAIRKKWISHAILDVQPTEPVPKDSPLWDIKEVTMSPHEAGLSFGEELATTFLENYMRYVRGEPLKYIVDMQAGY